MFGHFACFGQVLEECGCRETAAYDAAGHEVDENLPSLADAALVCRAFIVRLLES